VNEEYELVFFFQMLSFEKMTRLFATLSLVVVFSCKEKSDSESIISEPKKMNILADLTFSVDTVMVDTGEDLIILEFHLSVACLQMPGIIIS